jgi:hypothetical protein
VITGSCLCGGVRLRITGKLGPAGFCHCSQCRKANGSAFASNAPVRAKYVEVDAERADLVREYESSPGKFRAFCSRCGSPLYSRRDSEPELRRLRLGLLDGDPGRRPSGHVWVGSKAPWYEITDALPRFEQGLPPEPESSR